MFLAWLISISVDVLALIIFVQVALSWLVAFEIVNAKNEAAQNLTNLTKKITDPIYKPLKKYIPPVGGIDITPLVVILGLYVFKALVLSIILL
jgi:YggT family protein